MKHIEKKAPPTSFTKHIPSTGKWADFSRTRKKHTKQYMLEQEQNYLCCYCEKNIKGADAHIEHIRPKGDYPELTFEYSNLLVSCQGTHCSPDEEDTTVYICGHKKDSGFDEDLFLDPSQLRDIGAYFEFDDNGGISPSAKDPIKASYMINLLQLNEPQLAQSRENVAKGIRINLMKAGANPASRQKLKTILADESQDFISFLRHYFNPIVS